MIDDDNRSCWSLSPEAYASAQMNMRDARKKRTLLPYSQEEKANPQRRAIPNFVFHAERALGAGTTDMAGHYILGRSAT